MVGNVQWTAGPENKFKERNYELVARTMTSATEQQLQDFVDAIRVKDMRLMDAHAAAFFGGVLDKTLQDSDDSWFGNNPMWFWDCTASVDEIHQIMRESRARTCELLLAGATGIKLFKQCGHPRFRTVITWEGASEADASPVLPNQTGQSGRAWNPANVVQGTEVHVWVYTPYDAGYATSGLLAGEEFAARRQASAMLLDQLRAKSKADVRELMSAGDLQELVTFHPMKRIFRGQLAVEPSTGELPNVEGLTVTFREDVAEPPAPPKAPIVAPVAEEEPALPNPATRQGIEIAWRGAGEGEFQLMLREPWPAADDTRPPPPVGDVQGDRPISLELVQANILQPHVRDSCVVALLTFPDAKRGRAFLRDLEPRVQSADGHGSDVSSYRQRAAVAAAGSRRQVGEPYVGVGLSCAGYEALEIPQADRPTSAAFRDGMSSRAGLNDPPVAEWDAHLTPGAHAIVVIGAATPARTDLTYAYVRALADGHGVAIRGEERGATLRNRNGDGIEHFGYVDGRSQPLFEPLDVAMEAAGSGTRVWNPQRPNEDVLVEEPATPDGHGSYFVFRKLEQNVRQFRADLLAFAAELGLQGADAERAGALLVGRFEDGTPLALQQAAGMHSPVTNDFDYVKDPTGQKCPLTSHARIMNDRSPTEPPPLIVRRGVPYGTRDDDPNDGRVSNKPAGGVGLLFMAFVADIEGQFERLQARANSETQFDPIIGQREGQTRQPWPRSWGAGATAGQPPMAEVMSLRRSVTMMGGEYFFMPSKSFLRGPSAKPE